MLYKFSRSNDIVQCYFTFLAMFISVNCSCYYVAIYYQVCKYNANWLECVADVSLCAPVWCVLCKVTTCGKQKRDRQWNYFWVQRLVIRNMMIVTCVLFQILWCRDSPIIWKVTFSDLMFEALSNMLKASYYWQTNTGPWEEGRSTHM